MNDIGIGAVGAAIIAGLISLLGLIIGKEQKVSEFRQAWINELRECLVSYLANINAIADTIRVAISQKISPTGLTENYKALNEANHGIRLRVNDTEEPSIALLNAMDEFEALASSNSRLTLTNIRAAEAKFPTASKELLKFEWNRVKRGEKTYFWTRNIVIGLICIMLLIFATLWWIRNPDQPKMQAMKDVGSAVTASAERTTTALPEMQPSSSDRRALRKHTPDQKIVTPGDLTSTPTCSTPAIK